MGATSAHAQTNGGLALDRFEPAPAGDRMFGVPSPYAAGDLTPHLMALVDYAHNPLVLKTEPADTNAGSVVQSQMYLNLDAGLSLWKRVFADVDVPIAVYQGGNNPTAPGQKFTSPSDAQFGDVRLGARLVLWGKYHDPFQIALGGYVWLPTAPSGSFVGTGSVRGLPQLILGGDVAERLVWSAAAGPEIQGTSAYAGVDQGTELRWGAGVAVLLLESRHLQIGPEASGDVVFRDVQKRTTNAELLLGLKYRFLRFMQIGVAGGPGLTSGIGTPDFRAIASVAFTPEQTLDRDGDGIPDAQDACPDVPGVADPDPEKNGCPPPPPPSDRDGDGIPDAQDACPDVPGVANPDPAKNGCPPPPPDRDGDGIPDAQDACPDVPGVANPDPAKNGCPPPPPDRDGDGIPDAEDACPDEKGPRNPDPKKNGCPIVHVTEKEVVILEQVQFDTGKATIKPVSNDLLDSVATVLNSHPELLRLEVQGHTDNTGSKALNKRLSQARANAVMAALLSRGVDKKRLTAKGYGQDVPIADNTTVEGRQENRRVQFSIVEKKPKAAP
jgi:outer membrane protein OmpA-like peptidoglycan-associated protein